MKTLTMVTRYGFKGEHANKTNYVLIADDYSIVRLTGEELVKAIKDKKYNITNMGIGPSGLISTNGAIDKYTLIGLDTNDIVGKASPVVINRVETQKGLVGYTIFNTKGVLQEVTVKEIVQIHSVTPFSNGKLRHTQDGDIISSITGNYPLRTVEMKNNTNKSINLDLILISSSISDTSSSVYKYGGIIIECENAAHVSKMYSSLKDANEKLLESLLKAGSDEQTKKNLTIRRTATAGFYVVLPIDKVFELIKLANNKVNNTIGRVMISTVDNSDEEYTESVLILSPELKAIFKQSGTDRGNKVLSEYAKDIIVKLKDVKIA